MSQDRVSYYLILTPSAIFTNNKTNNKQMKYIIIPLILLLSSCNHRTECPVKSHVNYECLACPKPGHGVCYICNDPIFENEKSFNITKK